MRTPCFLLCVCVAPIPGFSLQCRLLTLHGLINAQRDELPAWANTPPRLLFSLAVLQWAADLVAHRLMRLTTLKPTGGAQLFPFPARQLLQPRALLSPLDCFICSNFCEGQYTWNGVKFTARVGHGVSDAGGPISTRALQVVQDFPATGHKKCWAWHHKERRHELNRIPSWIGSAPPRHV